MKKFTYLLSLTVAAFVLAAVGMIGCEGPAGAPGKDADATCKVCHNDESDLLAKQLQAASSKHLTGGHEERSEAECAACHTHEGFVDRMASGEMAASVDIKDATPPNCRTCHNVHMAYDSTDYAIAHTDPVTLWINSVEVDLKDGNMCANCHQPRMPSPLPTMGGGSVDLTSPYWGPHYGPQSSMLWGTAGYEIAGSVSYPAAGSSTHASVGCTDCHMVSVPEYGNLVGGHTLNMTYMDHGHATDNVAACSSCHTSIGEDFDYHDVMSETVKLTDSLQNVLVSKGWLTTAGRVNVSFGSKLTLAADDAGALLNWFMVAKDHSKGIHNPAYSTALLKNTLEYLNN